MDYVASAFMNKTVAAVEPQMPLQELEAAFVESQVSGFPVLEAGALVGVVSRSDLLARLANREHDSPADLTVADIMTSQVVTVKPDDHLKDVATLMYDRRIHRIFVVDEGRLAGIITPFDFVRLYAAGQIGADGQPYRTPDF